MSLRKMQNSSCWETAPIEMWRDFIHWYQTTEHSDFPDIHHFTHYFGFFSHETLMSSLTDTKYSIIKVQN